MRHLFASHTEIPKENGNYTNFVIYDGKVPVSGWVMNVTPGAMKRRIAVTTNYLNTPIDFDVGHVVGTPKCTKGTSDELDEKC